MSKTLYEKIEVMQHFANNGEIEHLLNDGTWRIITEPNWDWWKCTYRIKEQKKTITIEKWLCVLDDGEYRVFETSDISMLGINRVKLLDKYKVEL